MSNRLKWKEEDLSEEQLRGIGRLATKTKRDKYNRSPKEERTVDGIIFDSKKEMNYYLKLKLDPDVYFALRQIPFELPGKTKYYCDFLVFYQDGHYEFIDVKGMKTDMYKLKKRQVQDLYPVKIKEV